VLHHAQWSWRGSRAQQIESTVDALGLLHGEPVSVARAEEILHDGRSGSKAPI
jgi:hypothetical protein